MFNAVAQFQAFDAFRTGALSVKDAIRFALFGMGEQGVWYDPSNLYTMSQDSTGTVPVTAVEQPVGRLLDISGRGNHATQTTDAKRPVLSARLNLVSYSEDLMNPYWGVTYATRALSSIVNPFGGGNVVLLRESVDNQLHSVYPTGFTPVVGQMYTLSVYAKYYDGRRIGFVGGGIGGAGEIPLFDLQNGVVDLGSTTTVVKSAVAMPVLNSGGWYICQAIVVPSGSSPFQFICTSQTSNNTQAASTYAGDITKGVYVWAVDIRPTNVGVGLPVYQRVSATDYDTAGFPMYLRANGVGSTLTTSAIDLTGTDKISIWAGIRKQSDAAQGVIAELGSSIASVNGSVLLSAPFSAAGNYGFSSKGTTRQDNTITTYSSPITSVLMAQASISGPSNSLSVNGVVKGTNTASQGTGNYGNHVLNLFSRDGASLFFNGGLYQFILRGAETNAQTKSLVDLYMNSQTRAY